MLMVLTPEVFELYNLVTSVEGFKRNMQREAIKAGLAGDQPTGGAGVDQAAAAVKQPDAAGLDTKIRRDVLAKNILDNERLKEELQQARQQIGAMTPKKDE